MVSTVNWSDAGKKLSESQGDNTYENNSNEKCALYRINATRKELDNADAWRTIYSVGKFKIWFKLDTGAEVNCIPVDEVKSIGAPIEEVKNTKNMDYSSNKIKIHGKVNLHCVDPEMHQKFNADFIVVDSTFEPLLGLKSCVWSHNSFKQSKNSK